MNPGHFKWPSNIDIPLFLELEDVNFAPVSGKTPKVSIRRFREYQGALLDNWYWDGATFSATPFWFNMVETDNPGLYTYMFLQSIIGLEIQYIIYYKHETSPTGFAAETHIITNEVYIPSVIPDPIIIGPDSVMGQLELIKDGGTGLFDGSEHSLYNIGESFLRVLGLLHENSMLDNQQYDSNDQLTFARLRVFDSPANIPTTPGGSETTGLTQSYEVNAEYDGPNLARNFTMKRVL